MRWRRLNPHDKTAFTGRTIVEVESGMLVAQFATVTPVEKFERNIRLGVEAPTMFALLNRYLDLQPVCDCQDGSTCLRCDTIALIERIETGHGI